MTTAAAEGGGTTGGRAEEFEEEDEIGGFRVEADVDERGAEGDAKLTAALAVLVEEEAAGRAAEGLVRPVAEMKVRVEGGRRILGRRGRERARRMKGAERGDRRCDTQRVTESECRAHNKLCCKSRMTLYKFLYKIFAESELAAF